MVEQFTDRARRVMTLAENVATDSGYVYVHPEHILLGMIAEPYGLASNVLRMCGCDYATCRQALLDRTRAASLLGPHVVAGEKPELTGSSNQLIQLAVQSASDLGDSHVGTEHLLLGLCKLPAALHVFELLKACDASPEVIISEVLRLLGKAEPVVVEPIEIMPHTQSTAVELKVTVADWLKGWVGDRHECNKGNCYVCECWAAFDVMFRHVP